MHLNAILSLQALSLQISLICSDIEDLEKIQHKECPEILTRSSNMELWRIGIQSLKALRQ